MHYSQSEYISLSVQEILDNGFTLITANKNGIPKIIESLKNSIDKLFKKESWRGGWEGREQYMVENKLFNSGAKRLSNLIDKDEIFIELINNKILLKICRIAFKEDFFIGGVDAREPMKGNGQQDLHQDWIPKTKKNINKIENIIAFIFLDNTNKENGAMRLVPKSHRKEGWVCNNLKDPSRKHPEEVNIEAETGDILLMDATLWHSGTANKTGKRRRVIYIDYRIRSIPQLLNQKKYLSEETINKLDESQKALLKVRKEDPISEKVSCTSGDYCREKGIQWPGG